MQQQQLIYLMANKIRKKTDTSCTVPFCCCLCKIRQNSNDNSLEILMFFFFLFLFFQNFFFQLFSVLSISNSNELVKQQQHFIDRCIIFIHSFIHSQILLVLTSYQKINDSFIHNRIQQVNSILYTIYNTYLVNVL